MKFFSVVTFAMGAFAAATPSLAARQSDNGALLLSALKLEDQYTQDVANGWAAYVPNDPKSTARVFGALANQISQYNNLTSIVQSNSGLYRESTAQAYNDYLSSALVPDSDRERDQSIAAGPRLKQAGLLPFSIIGITAARGIVDNFANNLNAKTPASKKQATASLLSQIQKDVADTQASYIALASS